MEIAVVVLAIVALGGFVGWLWAPTRRRARTRAARRAARFAGGDSERADQRADRPGRSPGPRSKERSDQLRRAREQEIEAQTEIQRLRRELAASREAVAALEQSHRARSEELEQYRADLEQRFKGLALDALQLSNEEFRKQAEDQFKRDRELADTDLEKRQQAVDNLVKPVGETLEKLQKRVGEIEEKTRERLRHGGRADRQHRKADRRASRDHDRPAPGLELTPAAGALGRAHTRARAGGLGHA